MHRLQRDELDWRREWADQEQNRRDGVVPRARQILFGRARPTLSEESEPGARHGLPDDASGAVTGAAAPVCMDDVPF